VLSPTQIVGETRYTRSSYLFDRLAPYVDPDVASDEYAHLEEIPGVADPGDRLAWLADDYLRELANRDIAADPERFVRKSAIRAAAYLSPLKTPLGSSPVELRDGQLHLVDYSGDLLDAAHHWPPFLRDATHFVIALFAIPLGLLGMARASAGASPARRLAIVSLLFVAANIGLHALNGAETRYRLPLDPLFIVWACVAIGSLFPPRERTAAP
jgi:hypothetical protein